MGIKRFGDYDKTQAYGDFQPLPKGGYVVRILGATVHENSNGQYVIRQIKRCLFRQIKTGLSEHLTMG